MALKGQSYQSLSGEERLNLKIDGRAVVELDYKSIHMNILFAEKGFQLTVDPYIIKDIENDTELPRDTGKSLLLRLVNVDNIAAFKGQITKSGDADRQEERKRYEAQLAAYNSKETKFKPRANSSINIPILKGWIEHIPSGMTGDEALKKIYKYHPELEEVVNQKNSGLKLQRADSKILEEVLSSLSRQNPPIVALPVHDSVIVQAEHEHTAMRVMKEAYQKIYKGFYIPVKRSDRRKSGVDEEMHFDD